MNNLNNIRNSLIKYNKVSRVYRYHTLHGYRNWHVYSANTLVVFTVVYSSISVSCTVHWTIAISNVRSVPELATPGISLDRAQWA